MGAIVGAAKIKVLYDHQMFSIQKYGGITRYFCSMIMAMPALADTRLALISSDNAYLNQNRSFFRKPNLLPGFRFKGRDTLYRIIADLNKRYSRHVLKRSDYDIFHPTFYDDYFLRDLKSPFVLTVHDLTEFRYIHDNARSNAIRPKMEYLIKHATRIIAISEFTRRDIIRYFNIDEGLIDVIYHGYDQATYPYTPNGYGKYLLFVGHRAHYKNFSRCLDALAPILHSQKDLTLICVGEPFNREEHNQINALGLGNIVKRTHVDDAALMNLYSSAQLFIYPSLYEGFGMPILEAFANGCPVCLSHASCFPEIAGDAAAYFDPEDTLSITKCVESVLSDEGKRDALIAKGLERLQHFSWEKAASQTLKTYEMALMGQRN